MMYKGAVFSLLLFLTLSACALQKGDGENSSERPNILFIAVDDLRPEMNLYGASQINSPNLDQLARESMVFTRSYCNVPTCGASRASLLSGTRPTRHRFISYDTRKDVQVPEATSLPLTFKNNGYTTISNGKVYHHADDDTIAWNEIWRPENDNGYNLPDKKSPDLQKYRNGFAFASPDVSDTDMRDGKIATKGIADLRKLKESGSPFFLALGFMKPHLPFIAPQKYWDMYKREDIALPESYVQPKSTPGVAFHQYGELRSYYGIPKKGHLDEASAKELIHGYNACVSYVDAQIGRVLQELDDLGLAENTIVVLWGDHGWNLGEHMLWCKHCTFETSLHTPLIVKIPGKTKGNKSDAITEFVDIYPSLCDLAGIEKPAHLEGESFVPVIETGKREKNYAVSKFKDAVTLIKGDLFYTEWTNDKGESRARMLFDHSTDPLELNNLAEKEEYKQIVSKLSDELRQKWGADFLNNTNK